MLYPVVVSHIKEQAKAEERERIKRVIEKMFDEMREIASSSKEHLKGKMETIRGVEELLSKIDNHSQHSNSPIKKRLTSALSREDKNGEMDSPQADTHIQDNCKECPEKPYYPNCDDNFPCLYIQDKEVKEE